MAVPLPKICSILAHELRSPLSVLQGYIRLLQQQRDVDHPETMMLQAMLDATGRLTTIARQASDLGSWLNSQETTSLQSVAIAEILDEIDTRVPKDGTIAVVRSVARGQALMRADAPALATALVAVAESVSRETGSGVVELMSVEEDGAGAPTFSLRPRLAEGKADAVAGSAITRALSLDRGGAGLSLVAASYVLDAHGASLEAARTPGAIDIYFRDTGGAS